MKVIVVCCAVHWFSKKAVLKVLRKLMQLLCCDIDELQVSVLKREGVIGTSYIVLCN